MINFLIIAILFLLVVFIAFKVEHFKIRVIHIIIVIGVSFLLLTGYVLFSGKEVNLTTLEGISNSAKTYFSWLSAAGSNIVRVTSYAFNQEWKVDRETNNTGS